MKAKYTPAVMRLAKDIRKLTVGEMLALRDTLKGDFDLPPDAGVREPRNPVQPQGEHEIKVEVIENVEDSYDREAFWKDRG